MYDKIDDMISNAKLSQLLHKKSAEEERKTNLLWILAIIGVVASVAAIAYAVYRHLTPRYLDDFDGDFDYDEFDDDFDDDDEDVAVYVKPSATNK